MFKEQINNLKAEGFGGINVTVPLKELAFNISDETSNVSKKLRSANTLTLSSDKINADNTDAVGFINSLDKKTIEDSLSHLRNALKGTDIEEIKKKTQDLVQSSMKLGEAIYKSQQGAKPSPDNKDDPKNKEEKKDDNVVDADFEEVKDENKEKSA